MCTTHIIVTNVYLIHTKADNQNISFMLLFIYFSISAHYKLLFHLKVNGFCRHDVTSLGLYLEAVSRFTI